MGCHPYKYIGQSMVSSSWFVPHLPQDISLCQQYGCLCLQIPSSLFIQIFYFHWTLRNSASCCLKLFWITSLIAIRKSSKPSCKLTCPAFDSLCCPLITLNSNHRNIISNTGRPSYDAGDTSVASHCMRLTELVKCNFLG